VPCGNGGRNERRSDVILAQEVCMKQEPVILRGPYPTVEDTARLLGFLTGGLKELLGPVRSNEPSKAKNNGSGSNEAGSKVVRIRGDARTKNV
jgi:hypothetical protein